MEPLASLWLHSLRGVRGGLFTTEFARVDAVCSSRARAPLLRGARCVGVRGFFILLRTARHHSGATSSPSGPGATVGCSRLQPIWIKSPKPFCGPDPGVAGGVLAARCGSFHASSPCLYVSPLRPSKFTCRGAMRVATRPGRQGAWSSRSRRGALGAARSCPRPGSRAVVAVESCPGERRRGLLVAVSSRLWPGREQAWLARRPCL